MATKIYSPDLTIALNRLDRLSSAIPGAVDMTTRKFAEKILWMSDNVAPVVPKDTGDLQSTGHVERIEGGKTAEWAVVYGGAAPGGQFVNYALGVHDDLRPRRWKRPGSGPKFVEAHIESSGGELKHDLDLMLMTLTKKYGH